MVETGGSSWHQTNRGVSIYFTVYATLFFIVVILSKLLHDRPTLASFVPEAAMIILVGMFAGLIFYLLMGDENDANDAVESMLSFSPTVFFVVLLPPIIFNSGYHIQRDLFFRHIVPICLYACIGTILATSIMALFLFVFKSLYASETFQPSFLELLTFGALISATDPVSTLAVFQAKQVDPHLFYLVFGESVINDAVGLILFEALAHTLEAFQDQPPALGPELAQFLFDFVVGFCGSMCLGLIMGLGVAWLFKTIDLRRTPLLELCLYVPMMYTPFFLAEIARLSGIVTVLFAGIAARRYIEPNLSPGTAHNAITIFRLVAHVTEIIIFIELGLSVFGLSQDDFPVVFIIFSLLGCLFSRACNIYPITFIYNNVCARRPKEQLSDSSESQVDMTDMHPNKNGEIVQPNTGMIDDKKIPIKTAHMLWFSGLRGAVSYALVRTFPATGNQNSFVSTTMMIVLITTFLLGGTTELALQFLGIPTGVDEVEYMKSLDRKHLLRGRLHTFEAFHLRRWVIRDFKKSSKADDLSVTHQDESDLDGYYAEHVEMTEMDHIRNVETDPKVDSVYNFGNKI